MTLLKRNNLSLVTLINIIFCLFPLSIIIGNFSVNTNLFLFCLVGIFYLKFKIINMKYDFALKIIFLFFLTIFISTLFNYMSHNEYNDINILIKSIAFFRFFLLLIIIYYLNEYNILNFKYFLLSLSFLLLVISLDIIFQYIYGFNTIGLKNADSRHYSGFFGTELIAGGFMQNFSFFVIFFINFLFKKKNILQNVLTIFVLVILGMGIFLSGNKMSLIIFLFGLPLAFFFNKALMKNIIFGLIILLILFKATLTLNSEIRYHYMSIYKINYKETYVIAKKVVNISFLNDIKNIFLDKTISLNKKSKVSLESSVRVRSDFIKLLITAVDTWKFNKVFGNGIKSFRSTCHNLVPPEYNLDQTNKLNVKNRLCSTHPHNYYFEILSELGILGISIVIIIYLSFLVFIIKNLSLMRGDKLDNLIFAGATIHLFLAVFPFRSTGSIFTTSNTIYLILFIALMLSSKQSLTSTSSIIK